MDSWWQSVAVIGMCSYENVEVTSSRARATVRVAIVGARTSGCLTVRRVRRQAHHRQVRFAFLFMSCIGWLFNNFVILGFLYFCHELSTPGPSKNMQYITKTLTI
jgi:hypothetical protein